MDRFWLAVGAINGFIAVAAGAFGAHGLKRIVSPEMIAVFDTGARYQMYHALAMIAVAWVAGRFASPTCSAAGWCFLAGVLIFSGSLYALVLTGQTKLGAVTPIGGVLMLIGWLLLVVTAVRAPVKLL